MNGIIVNHQYRLRSQGSSRCSQISSDLVSSAVKLSRILIWWVYLSHIFIIKVTRSLYNFLVSLLMGNFYIVFTIEMLLQIKLHTLNILFLLFGKKMFYSQSHIPLKSNSDINTKQTFFGFFVRSKDCRYHRYIYGEYICNFWLSCFVIVHGTILSFLYGWVFLHRFNDQSATINNILNL